MRNTLNYESKDMLLRPKRAHISSQKMACAAITAHNTLVYNQLHKATIFRLKHSKTVKLLIRRLSERLKNLHFVKK